MSIELDTTQDLRLFAGAVGDGYNALSLDDDNHPVCNRCANNLSDADCVHDYAQI